MRLSKTVRRGLTLVVAAVLLSGVTPVLAESPDDIVVFVNKEVPVSAVSLEEMRQMYLGIRTSWPSGQRIVCVNALDGTRVRDVFRSRVLRMSQDEEARHWEDLKVQGRANEPAAFSSTVKAVFRLKGGIGYGLRSEVRGDTVKIVGTITGR